jgi:amino acid permease
MLNSHSMKILVTGVLNSIGDVSYLIFILLIFLFMFGVLGQNIFSELWDNVEDSEGMWTFSHGI